jgi:cell wall-associated NlpC family hydrolase
MSASRRECADRGENPDAGWSQQAGASRAEPGGPASPLIGRADRLRGRRIHRGLLWSLIPDSLCMKLVLSRRLTLLLWLLIPAAALGLYFIPLSNRFTKICTLMIVLVMWRGLLALMWPHRRLRWVVPGLTLLAAGFLQLPGRAGVNDDAVRASYIHSLKSYEGSLYYWGGESRRGIDCSGLVRCGMMNGLAKTGLRSADPGLVRQSLSLWWNDASAWDLGKEHRGLTKLLFQARSINDADHSRLLPRGHRGDHQRSPHSGVSRRRQLDSGQPRRRARGDFQSTGGERCLVSAAGESASVDGADGAVINRAGEFVRHPHSPVKCSLMHLR